IKTREGRACAKRARCSSNNTIDLAQGLPPSSNGIRAALSTLSPSCAIYAPFCQRVFCDLSASPSCAANGCLTEEFQLNSYTQEEAIPAASNSLRVESISSLTAGFPTPCIRM